MKLCAICLESRCHCYFYAERCKKEWNKRVRDWWKALSRKQKDAISLEATKEFFRERGTYR